jgi:hypothetical protein
MGEVFVSPTVTVSLSKNALCDDLAVMCLPTALRKFYPPPNRYNFSVGIVN